MKKILTILLAAAATTANLNAQNNVRYRGTFELDPGLCLVQMTEAQQEEMGFEVPLRYVYAGTGIGTVQGIEIKEHFFAGAGLTLLGAAITNGDGISATGFGLGLFLHSEYVFRAPESKNRPFVALRGGFKGCEGITSPTLTLGGGMRFGSRFSIALMYSLGHSVDDEYDNSPLTLHIPYIRLSWAFNSGSKK